MAAAVTGVVAAAFWIAACVSPLPPMDTKPDELRKLIAALRKQDWKNSWAALFAAAAASLQVASAHWPGCAIWG